MSTDTSYTSPNISIQIKKKEYDSGVLDYSAKGKHLRYGTMFSCFLLNINIIRILYEEIGGNRV